MTNQLENQASDRHTFRFIGCRSGDHLWSLSDEESWHATKVLRLKEGTIVEATDGRGSLVRGELLRMGKNLAIRVTAESFSEAPSTCFELVLGALKPGDLDDVLPGIVELGATKISVYLTQQTGKDRINSKALERWQRIIVTAVKQSKRLWLPELTTWGGLDEWLKQLHTTDNSMRWIFTEPDATAPGTSHPFLPLDAILRLKGGSPGDPSVRWLHGIIGSERGFSPAETKAAANAGFKPISLGSHVLRSKTAAHAAATILAVAAMSHR